MEDLQMITCCMAAFQMMGIFTFPVKPNRRTIFQRPDANIFTKNHEEVTKILFLVLRDFFVVLRGTIAFENRSIVSSYLP